MPVYRYRARDRAGKIVEGTLSALNPKKLRQRLDRMDYLVIDFSKKRDWSSFRLFLFARPAVSFKDLSIFCWQLYTMLNAGVEILRSLDIIASQTRNKAFKKIIEAVGRDIEEGVSFANALNKHPEVFPPLIVRMVNAGEVGGVLDQILKRLATFYEGQAEMRSQIKTALTYPLLLLAASIGVSIFLISYVLPKFAAIFEGFGTSLPLPTTIMLGLGGIFRQYFLIVFGVIAGLIAALSIYIKTPIGRFQYDTLKLRMPIFGNLLSKIIISRFAKVMAMLVQGGIPILTALDVLKGIMGNVCLSKAIDRVSSAVEKGQPISQPLATTGLFPEMVTNMIKVGEETGSLDSMLSKVTDFYDREVEEAVKAFTRLIEPVMLIFMTVVVGFIAISLFLPLTDITQIIRR
jgi:type IV pilus assembly protein PilC